MADDFVSVKLNGLKDVDDRLVLLGAVAGEKVMRATLLAAAKPFEEQAEANISVIRRGSGALHKAVRRVYLRAGSSTISATGSRFVVAVAPKVKDRVAIALANLFYKRKTPIRGIYWGHLVEWGAAHRGGGRISGHLVFTRAARSGAQQAVDLFTKLIGPRVERALKKQRP